MSTLYLVGYDSERTVEATRAVRTVLRDLGCAPDAGAAAATAILDLAYRDGYAYIGEHESALVLDGALGHLERHGCAAEVDFTPPPAPEPEAPEAADEAAPDDGVAGGFTAEAYETALALMGASSGNPLDSAAHARTLMHSTNDEGLYGEVIAVLAFVFRPWLPQMLHDHGMISINEEATL